MNAYRLPDGTSWPTTPDEDLHSKLNCYNAETVTLTQHEAWKLREIVGAYDHLLSHPAGTGSVVAQLRMLRRAVIAAAKVSS